MNPEEILEYSGSDRIVKFTEYLLLNAGKIRSQTFQSTFPSFDKKIGLLETGRVVVISGHAKNGKTLFAESWAHGIMQRDPEAITAIFSFEIETEKLLAKYVYQDKLPIYVPLELKTMDFEWLKERCLEAKLKHHCKIILIDHLHFLIDMAMKQNMSLNIGAFMRRLKTEIAMGMGMAVLLIAHQDKGERGEEASMRGARDSSFIGQECDAFVTVTRRKNFNEADFAEIANRRDAFFVETLRAELNPAQTEEDAIFIDENYSHGLATVKVDVSRMSGAFDARTTFRKRGDFLVEV